MGYRSLGLVILLAFGTRDHVLDIVADLLFFGRIGVPPHGPDGVLEQVVHGLDGAALELRHAEKNKDDADVGQHGVQEKYSVAKIGHHVWGGLGDTVVDNPVDEEADRHGEGPDSCREDLGCRDVGHDGPTKRPITYFSLVPKETEKSTGRGALTIQKRKYISRLCQQYLQREFLQWSLVWQIERTVRCKA